MSDFKLLHTLRMIAATQGTHSGEGAGGRLAELAADRIEELNFNLKTVAEGKVDVVVKLTQLQTYLEDFFTLLDKTEETDEGRVFRPNHISSCRAEDGQKLENLLRLMKAAVEDRQK